MNLDQLAKTKMCSLDNHCPTLFRGEDGELYVQGYLAPELQSQCPEGETMVRIDRSLMEEIAKCDFSKE